MTATALQYCWEKCSILFRILKQQKRLCGLHRYERRIGTEQCYVYWARRYVLFHDKKHPNTMGAPEVRSFCSHLAEKKHVSASTQNQAFNALVFLYRHVVGEELGVVGAVRAKRPRRLPVVLSRSEVQRVLSFLSGTQAIMATLLYGSGLRLMECHRLRVKDIDIEQLQDDGVTRSGDSRSHETSEADEGVAPDLCRARLRRS